jgi:hypothetical protein
MQIYEETNTAGQCLIVLNQQEGQALAKLLEEATKPKEGKPVVRKNSKAWKIGRQIVDLLPVW